MSDKKSIRSFFSRLLSSNEYNKKSKKDQCNNDDDDNMSVSQQSRSALGSKKVSFVNENNFPPWRYSMTAKHSNLIIRWIICVSLFSELRIDIDIIPKLRFQKLSLL